ncbi:phosphotransferase [Streptomonospora salina]|uniref:Protein kinase domain-containing protein n=1 Tax=Streptomonospora salina TaxID=104205 RepID=A0A841EAT9_9ACTN|nr:phosphotransferase [Streptomonospora salina]MBB5998168.1 hypothetical protein [Streptomonospora salina]
MDESDREIVDASIAWPVSRIEDAGHTVGVVTAKAPEHFYADFAQKGREGEPRRTSRHELRIDHLAQSDDWLERKGVARPTAASRSRIAQSFLEIGAMLARHGVVYGDWSYSNAMWDGEQGRVYLIDMDSCGLGDRAWIESPGWEDRLFPHPKRLTRAADDYRLTLLALRALTGERDASQALEALPTALRRGEFGRQARAMLDADTDAARPGIGAVSAALAASESRLEPSRPVGSGVVGYRRVRRVGGRSVPAPAKRMPDSSTETRTRPGTFRRSDRATDGTDRHRNAGARTTTEPLSPVRRGGVERARGTGTVRRSARVPAAVVGRRQRRRPILASGLLVATVAALLMAVLAFL